MFAELDNEFIKAINEEENILVSPTFDCECKQVQNVVPYRIAMRYKNNKDSITIDAPNVCETYGIIDSFGLANCLSHNSNSILVVEANYSLEDRIVLSGINVDIYSLLEKRLIEHDHFIDEEISRTIDKDKTPLTYCEIKSDDSVYTEHGQYVLTDLIESGAEAQIFKICNNPKILAKIYNEDENGNFVLTSQKLENIKILKEVNDYWDVPWLALPTDIIYADSICTKPIGYIMKYFDEVNFLSNNTLFSGGDISIKFSKHNEAAIKDVLDICIKFVRQILFLALNDIHISDYNDKNFAVPIKSDSKIVMVDTDSYCCEGYVSECMTYYGCLSKKYECNTRLDLINICDESLYVFIFTCLALDFSFVPMRKSEFRFSASKLEKIDNANIRAKWDSIPKNLQDLFINVFDMKNPPSIGILLYELEVAQKQRFANTKYIDIYKEALDIITPQTQMAPQQSEPMPSQHPEHIPEPLPPPPLYPQKKKKVWIYICIGIGAVLTIWRFGYGHLWGSTDESIPSKSPNSTEAVETSSSQIQRYETDDGNHMRYKSNDRNISSAPPSSTEAVETPSPQIQRYETDNGYYLSYEPELNGYIEFHWNNGDIYNGDFVDGQMTGNGTYYYANGTKYIGDFLNGNRHGQGILYDGNGNEVYDGSWKDGFFSGEGTYHFPNNSKYQNIWENGTCNGGKIVELKFVKNDEPAAKGYWSENVFYGSYYVDGQWYELP